MKKTKNKIGMKYYLSQHKIAIIIYILTSVIACACDAILTICLANALAEITNAVIAGAAFKKGLMLLITALALYLVRRGAWWIGNYIYFKYSNVIMAEISLDLTKRCFQLTSSTFSDNNSGAFIQRILNDPTGVLDNLSAIVDFITGTLTSCVVLIYIVTLNWIIGLIYVAFLIGLFFLETYRQKIRKKNKLKNRKISDKTYSLVGEIVKSEKDIKSLNLEDKLFDITKNSLNELRDSNYTYRMKDCNLWSTRNFIIDMLCVGVLILGVALMEKSLLTLSTYILLFSYKNSLFEFVWNTGSIAQAMTDIKVYSSRMFSLFDEKLYPIDTFGKQKAKKFKGKIEFKNVSYAYCGLEEKDNDERYVKGKPKPIKRIKLRQILDGLSFTIEPNSTVAFVGKSGSGKSTILNLITKLFDADKGQVLLDGHDIKSLDKTTLRDNISLINQFPYIFDMTIKENLLLVKKDATDDELWEVLKKANLDEDVKNMPKGIDSKVGETGIKLSGGQRQRLAIARALLKQTKIIIFDESTSSLDNFAQKHIQNSIENLKGDHTIVIVAHRLSTIKNVDKIYFLNDGKIVDSGTFEELFNNNIDFQNMFLIENI